MHKADSIEVRRRIDQVYTMLLSGLDSRQIVQYAAENWNISERRAREYIAQANELFEQAAHPRREKELGRALARLDRMYAAALKVQDLRTCLSVQKEINALMGLYPEQRHVVTIEHVRNEVIADIRAGRITYEALASEDQSLADELFKLAGVPIQN